MRIVDALHHAAEALRALLDRIGRRTAVWLAAGLPLVTTCEHADHPLPPIPAPVAEVAPKPAALPRPPAPEQPLGNFLMTMYYIAAEDEVDRAARKPAANDNAAAADDAGSVLAAIGPDADAETPVPDLVPMYSKSCEPLVHVSPAFAAQARLQGTGRLRDGRLINVAGKCPCAAMCFHIPARPRAWGTGGSGRALAPFRMVAVDPRVVKMGTLLYVPALDGLRMPGPPPHGGYVHDGCVVAADTGGSIKGRQLDLFVGRQAYFKALGRRGSHAWMRQIPVWSGAGRCTDKGGKVSRSQAAAI